MKNLELGLLISNNKMHSHYINDITCTINMSSSHIHEHYEVLYVSKGSRTLIVENKKTFSFTENSIAFIPPYVKHKTHGEVPYDRCLLNFSKDVIEKLKSTTSLDLTECFDSASPMISFSDKDIETVVSIFRQMIDLNSKSDIYSETQFTLLAGQLLTLALLNKNGHKSETKCNPHTFLEMASYLENNFSDDITLNTLSNKFYINRYDISRKFSQQFGMSFTKYLSRIRVNNAKSLLETTNTNVTQIAQLCGFQSSSNFTRVFKSITGVSPSEYRQDHMHISDNDIIPIADIKKNDE